MATTSGRNEELECLIKYYFSRGFEYKDILKFLSEYHGKHIAERTLQRKLREYNLKRRRLEYNIDEVVQEIRKMLDGPQCMGGYRYVWHALKMKGIMVPRVVIQELLRELDPEGCLMRRAHRLKRRAYHNAGPNAAWHADGYDKLKQFGFPMHGCIDGWSRKIMWLYVTRSNNYPDNIASYYLDAVEQYGCPIELCTDLGTENGTMATIHSFFRNKDDAHRYVTSPQNQRIEGLWSFFRRSRSTWWINLFQDLIQDGQLNTCDPLEKCCLWFCFSDLIQKDLAQVCKHWNTHRIRKSRFDTISGQPDALYFLPNSKGGMANLALSVPTREMSYARDQLVDNLVENEHLEYFKYVVETNGIRDPVNWRESLQLYYWLLRTARQG